MSDVVYVYGFAAKAATPPAALRGMHGAAVHSMQFDDVHAIYSLVPSTEFADGMDERLQDLNWVGARGLEHERVVAWFVDQADIVPVSLFTLYSSEAALRDDITARLPTIRAQIHRLAGQREWDLKVSYDQMQLAEHAAAVLESIREIDAEIAAAAAGRRFLLERKRADMIRKDLAAAAFAKGRALLERAAAHATAVEALPLPRAEPMSLPVVLNAALLVRRDAERALLDDIADEIERLGSMGITAQFTGPWAPYRFLQSES
jgi:hypothetical protein